MGAHRSKVYSIPPPPSTNVAKMACVYAERAARLDLLLRSAEESRRAEQRPPGGVGRGAGGEGPARTRYVRRTRSCSSSCPGRSRTRRASRWGRRTSSSTGTRMDGSASGARRSRRLKRLERCVVWIDSSKNGSLHHRIQRAFFYELPLMESRTSPNFLCLNIRRTVPTAE